MEVLFMTTQAANNKTNTATVHKKTVERSNSYPAFSIEYAFDLTRKIYLQFGSSAHNNRETIAKVLKMSSNYLIIPLSTATQYGLLEMKSKIGYNPTPLFVRYYKPETENEKRDAQIECLKRPKLYEALLNAYSGNIIPTSQALATTLFRRYNIAENASLKAAEIFIDNLKSLSLLDEENKLLPFDKEEIVTEKEIQAPFLNVENKPISNQIDANGSQTSISGNNLIHADLSMGIKLNGGRRATLIYPDDITDNDWSKIVRVINAMKEYE